MHRDGFELNKSFCFTGVFACITGLDGAQNTPFFENITNQIFRLKYAQLICETVRIENKRLCNVMFN